MAAAECDGDGPVGSLIEQTLGGALEWMLGLGFKPPNIRVREGNYVVYLSDSATTGNAVGNYGRASGVIRFDTDYLAEEDPNEIAHVATHELFHGVQDTYLSDNMSSGLKWIEEGMADAVATAYVTSGQSGTVWNDPESQSFPRLYSDALTEPRSKDQAYATSHFWLALGDMLGSRDRVGYLHPFLLALRRGTTVNKDSSLQILDDLLKASNPGGLAYYFPRVAAQYTADLRHFTQAANETVGVAQGRAQTLRGELAPVAARRYAIVRDDESTCEEPVSVEVSFDAQSPTLHHAFDGVLSDEIETARDGVYRATLDDGDSLVVHVANVAEVASETVAASYTLRISGAPSCACGDYLAVAEALVTGPGGELEVEGQRVQSPVGVHKLVLPFEALRVTARGRAFDYYPAVTMVENAEDEVTLMLSSPEEGTIEAMRSQPGVRVEGELTTAVPSGDVEVGEAFYEGAGRGSVVGSFSVEGSERQGPQLEFAMNTLGFADGTLIQVEVGAATAGTYRWDGRTPPMSPLIRVRGGEVLLVLDSDVELTLEEVVPGRCVSGVFSGGAYTEPGEPSTFRVTGNFFLRAPPGLGDTP